MCLEVDVIIIVGGGKLAKVQAVADDFVPGSNHRLTIFDRDNGFNFLIDTGANISVIPVTKKQKLSTSCSDYKLFAANNTQIKTYGTRTFNVNLNLRRPYRWTFVIADVSQPILGADFLEHHNLIVDLRAKKLIDKQTNLLTFARIVHHNEPSLSTIDNSHQFLDLLNEFSEITKPISFKKIDKECDDDMYHYIEVTGQPVHARSRPLPPDRYKKVKEEFKLMQEMGICRPSKSQWASPLHVVSKKNGDIRPVGDYRRLNAITKPDRYPVPRLHDFTYILAGKKIFTRLDINRAYHFIKIAPEDVEKTAVICPFGLFEFLRLPFGLRNGSQSFQRFMSQKVLKGLDFLFNFVDDVIIASDNINQHREHLRQVFNRFLDFGITINLAKCDFGKSVIEFLGYEVSVDGILPLDHKIKAIMEFPRPETVEQMRRFLGMVNFYRANIPHAAEIQSSLNDFLKNSKKKDKTKVLWSDKTIKDFEKCKLGLKNAVRIAHPVCNVPLALMTDASDKSAGAVLQQKIDNNWIPLGYFSKKFTTAQQKYSTYDRELTAIFLAIKHFRYLIEGQQITIFTDHKPLTFAFHKLETNCETSRRTRQLLFISEFTTDVKYIKGSDNNIADALSRVEAIQIPSSIDYAELAVAQESDMELTQLIGSNKYNISLKRMHIPNCEKDIYCENSTSYCKPYIPKDHRKNIFESIHSLGHPGIRASRKLIGKRFFWPGLNRDVGQWAKTCIQCQKSKISRHTVSELQQFSNAERLSHVHLDIVGPLPPCQHGHRYIVTMIDRFTRWPEAIPVSEITAEVIAKVFYEKWICRFGTVFKVTSDQGRQFESSLFTQLLKLMGIKKSRSSPYHPQCNGIIERWHRSMKQALTARVTNNTSWCNELPTVLLGLRAVGRSDNNVSPAEYMYGQTIRLPGDFYDISDKHIIDDNAFLEQLRYNISMLKPVPSKVRNSRTLFVHKELNNCEYVFIRNDAVRKPLVPPYNGPYRVLSRSNKIYTIQLPKSKVNVSIDRLKPAFILNDQCPCDEYTANVSKQSEIESNINDKDKIKTTKSGRKVRMPVRFLNC